MNIKDESNYKESKHKWLYRWIAVKHFMSPEDVYEIAHGYYYMNLEVRKVWKDLVKYNVIHDEDDTK